MAKVHSHEAFTGAVIKLEGTWGTDPGTWGTASYKLPVLSFDPHYDVEEFPPPDEFGALGGLQAVDLGRRSITGSISVLPSYNTTAFWTLFSQFWGTENLVNDRSIWDATTPVTNLNTHIWTPGTALATGLAARLWLGGAGPAGSAYFLLILGMVFTKMTWEQPRNGRAKVTFDFIAKSAAATLGTGETIPAAASSTIVKAVDFTTAGGRSNGKIYIGTTMASFNTMGFTITVDKKIELDDNFLQSLLDVNKPGVVGTREVTLEIDTDLEQDWGAAAKPWLEFVNQTVTSVSIAYDSGVTAVSPEEYNFKFDFPSLVWTDVRPQLTQAGALPYPLTGKAQMGLVSALDTPFSAHALPTGLTDIRACCHVIGTDDGDAKYDVNLANAT